MSEQIPIKLIGLKEAIEELSKLQSEAEAQCKETCHFDCKHEDARFYLHCAESSRLALTAERDALSATLRQGAESDADLRTRYTALEKERDGLKDEIMEGFDRIFLAVPQAEDEQGTELSLPDKIQILVEQVARLSAPVSEREWDSIWHSTARDFANKLIASRTAPAKETK